MITAFVMQHRLQPVILHAVLKGKIYAVELFLLCVCLQAILKNKNKFKLEMRGKA